MFLDATDSVFARINSSLALDFYLGDHLGSIRGLENTSGGLDDTINYDAWGNITSESNPSNGDRYKFTGREWDSPVSLQYNLARYYEPTAGRWISQDPARFAAGDGNLYRYVMNRPLTLKDPSGLAPSAAALTSHGKGGGAMVDIKRSQILNGIAIADDQIVRLHDVELTDSARHSADVRLNTAIR